MPCRTTVWKPDSSSFTSYVPGTSDGKRYVPAASVTPFIEPDTRTGLLMVIVTPGTTPPCSSVALTRMLPVCTCALADAATPDASNTNRRRTHRFMLPPEKENPPTLSNRCIGFQSDLSAGVAETHRISGNLDLYCPV